MVVVVLWRCHWFSICLAGWSYRDVFDSVGALRIWIAILFRIGAIVSICTLFLHTGTSWVIVKIHHNNNIETSVTHIFKSHL